jgi:hypothetical protein
MKMKAFSQMTIIMRICKPESERGPPLKTNEINISKESVMPMWKKTSLKICNSLRELPLVAKNQNSYHVPLGKSSLIAPIILLLQ